MLDFLSELDRIVAKDINDLTADDIAFLKARKSYLNDQQLAHLESVLEPKKQRTYKELQQLAIKKGIKPVGKTREQLEALIN